MRGLASILARLCGLLADFLISALPNRPNLPDLPDLRDYMVWGVSPLPLTLTPPPWILYSPLVAPPVCHYWA